MDRNPPKFSARLRRAKFNENQCKNKFLSTSSAAGEKFLGYFDVRLRFLLRISSFLTPNPQNFPLRGRSNTPPYVLTPPLVADLSLTRGGELSRTHRNMTSKNPKMFGACGGLDSHRPHFRAFQNMSVILQLHFVIFLRFSKKM